MWIFTKLGFYSVTLSNDNTNLMVRARVRKDLDKLRGVYPGVGPTVHTPNSDYKYRVIVSHDAFALIMANMIEDIRYTNFKNEVAKCQGQARHDIYMSVWAKMLNAEAEEERMNVSASYVETGGRLTALQPLKKKRAAHR